MREPAPLGGGGRHLLAAALLAAAGPALADKRLGLVVGCDSCGGPATEQAQADAVRVRNALQDAGFLVDLERNPSPGQLRAALRGFGARLAGPERDTVGVFYFVGPGAQSGGRNYLIASGQRPASEDDLPRAGVELGEIVELLQTGAGRRLVLIDAAVPLAWRGSAPPLTPGMARAKAPPGFLVGFSQEPDHAPRGLGPYAAALESALRQPGLALEALFARVRRVVADRTAGGQLPWENAALDLDLPLHGASARTAQASADEALWSTIQHSADLALFENYLERFPDGLHASAARRRLRGEGLETARGFRECPVCPEMVGLPRGSFQMGSERGADNERPVHTVSIGYPLAVSRFEVTLGEWNACVAEGGCDYSPPGGEPADHPVARVSWQDAQTYTAWLSRRTGRAYRLPSEAEWEYAARGGARTEFHWGDAIEPGRAHCYGCAGAQADAPETALPVGRFPPNGFGLHDMAGNVSEWTQDCYLPSYAGAPADGRAREQGRCEYRVFRGGSWYLGPERMRLAFRNGGLAGLRAARVGFRVVRSP